MKGIREGEGTALLPMSSRVFSPPTSCLRTVSLCHRYVPLTGHYCMEEIRHQHLSLLFPCLTPLYYRVVEDSSQNSNSKFTEERETRAASNVCCQYLLSQLGANGLTPHTTYGWLPYCHPWALWEPSTGKVRTICTWNYSLGPGKSPSLHFYI
jgi:hypothetical protein